MHTSIEDEHGQHFDYLEDKHGQHFGYLHRLNENVKKRMMSLYLRPTFTLDEYVISVIFIDWMNMSC
jgi:hypothetical protein